MASARGSRRKRRSERSRPRFPIEGAGSSGPVCRAGSEIARDPERQRLRRRRNTDVIGLRDRRRIDR